MRLEAGEKRIGRIHDAVQRLFEIRWASVGIEVHEIPLGIVVHEICEGLVCHYSPPGLGVSLCKVRTRKILSPPYILAAKGHARENLFARASLRPIMKSLIGLKLGWSQRKRGQIDPALPGIRNQAVLYSVRAITLIDD